MDNHVPETDRLEFKSRMYGHEDREKREMLRDVTALANHRGGMVILGVDENEDHAACAIVGVPPAHREPWDLWLGKLCLSNVEPRILGLHVYETALKNGNVVVVIDVPESAGAPHMITHDGLNQFWRRHGRQKVPMTVDEIRDAILRTVDNEARIERFTERRYADITQVVEGRCTMIINAIPSYFRDESLFDVRDDGIRNLIAQPPHVDTGHWNNVACGRPIPTLNDLRSGRHPTHVTDADRPDDYLEVWRNGYVEFSTCLRVENRGGLYFATIADTAYIVSFVAFTNELYKRYLDRRPVVFGLSILNAHGLMLTSSTPSHS